MNIQHSAERMFQAIARCHRFGQKRQVDVYWILTDAELKILQNYERKVSDMREMTTMLVKFMAEFHDLKATRRVEDSYIANSPMQLPKFMKGSK